MDFGDLSEYGLKTNGQDCETGSICLTRNSFMGMDDALNKGHKFTNKFLIEATELYRRAQCHPQFRSEVTPKVQSIYTTFPFSLCTWPFACIIDLPLCCFCSCFECPYFCFFQCPWNTVCNTLFAIFLGFSFILLLIGDLISTIIFNIKWIPGIWFVLHETNHW